MFKAILIILSVGSTVTVDTTEFVRPGSCRVIRDEIELSLLLGGWGEVNKHVYERDGVRVSLICVAEKSKMPT